MATIVWSAATNGSGAKGTLFEGNTFWLSQRVPQRSRFVAEIEANGGTVTLLDKKANIKIVDHARKEALVGTHSYQFIERSLRNRRLENLEDHIVGPPAGSVRAIASITQPPRSHRVPFTAADDNLLWSWVANTPQKFGRTDGNEIYKQLEKRNNRHPWQSWRDRWIKYVKHRPPPTGITPMPPLTPPSDNASNHAIGMTPALDTGRQLFNQADIDVLLDSAESIEDIDPEQDVEAWNAWAEKSARDRHGYEWKAFWVKTVRPIYLEKQRQAAQAEAEAVQRNREAATTKPRFRQPTVQIDKGPSYDSELLEGSPLSHAPPRRSKAVLQQTDGSTDTSREMSSEEALFLSAQEENNEDAPTPPRKRKVAVRTQCPQNDVEESPRPSKRVNQGQKLTLQPLLSPAQCTMHEGNNDDEIERGPITQVNDQWAEEADEVTLVPPDVSSQVSEGQQSVISEVGPIMLSFADGDDASSIGQGVDRGKTDGASPRNPIGLDSSNNTVQGGFNSSSLLQGCRAKPKTEEISQSRGQDAEAAFTVITSTDAIPSNLSRQGSQLDVAEQLTHETIEKNVTQSIIREATQLLEFGVPPPDGGWDDVSLDHMGNDNPAQHIQGDGTPITGDVDDSKSLVSVKSESVKSETNSVMPLSNVSQASMEQDDEEAPDGGAVGDVESIDLGSNEDLPKRPFPTVIPETIPPSSPRRSPSPQDETTPTVNYHVTQALLTRGATQALDLAVAEPAGGWDSMLSPPPVEGSSIAPSSPVQVPMHDSISLDDFIAALRNHGYDLENILTVLKRTSLNAQLAERVLRRIKKGKGWRNMKGVWTDEDDSDLESTDARRVMRVEKKHGEDGTVKREGFLKEWRQD